MTFQRKTKGLSIREKITLLATGISFLALSFMALISITYEWFSDRTNVGTELLIQADIIGKNSIIALKAEYDAVKQLSEKGPIPPPGGPSIPGPGSSASPGGPLAGAGHDQYFRDALVSDYNAIGTLNTLQRNEHIVSAAIYTRSGRLFSKYVREGSNATLPLEPQTEKIDYGYESISLFSPILDKNNELVGTIYLNSDLGALWAKTKGYSVIIFLVGLGAFLIASLLSIFLQVGISGPILSLAKTASIVSDKKDYSIRATSNSQDEVNVLVASFNQMLGAIEQREASLNQMTQQLKQSNIELEEKVAARTADLAKAMKKAREARDEAIKAAGAKSQFLANMSHEIRTPMNAIIGLTDLALKNDMPPKAADQITKVKNSSRQLLGIINDILDFSKLEAGRMELDIIEFDLHLLIASLYDLVGLNVDEKGLEFIIDIAPDVPRQVSGDSLRLSQVLTNLVNNAVKFTHTGEIVVTVRLESKSSRRAKLVFSIIDTGIGIPYASRNKLFESFSQVDNSDTRKYGGTGLGLSICKLLVEMMGGELDVESTPGKGSRFFFTLVLDIQQASVGQHDMPPDAVKDLRALVIDDNATARNVIASMLEDFGLSVEACESGAEALHLFEASHTARPFHFIFADAHMPSLDGQETLLQLHTLAQPSQVKPKTVLMIPAFTAVASERSPANESIDTYLTKPVSPSSLLESLRNLIGYKASQNYTGEPAPDESIDVAEHLSGAHVLLAEDIALNREVVEGILEDYGVTVEMAENGQAALAALENTSFDAVLMDVQMPVMDGLQATRKIRNTPGFAGLPIIATTAHAMQGDKEKCCDAGMNDYVSKPIDESELVSVLAKWIPPASQRRTRSQSLDHAKETAAATNGEQALPQALAGIDIADGLARMRGKQAAYRRILIGFAKHYDQAATSIRALIAAADYRQAADDAHAIKGAAGNISAKTLFLAAKQLEAACKSEKGEDIQQALVPFELNLAEVLASCRSLEIGTEAAPMESASIELPDSGVFELMDILDVQIGTNSFSAKSSMQNLFTQLGNHAKLENERSALDEAIHNLNFKQAAIELAALRQKVKTLTETAVSLGENAS